MYWAVTEFGACAGIEVMASQNSINYNGMNIVKSGSQPLDDINDFQVIKELAGSQNWDEPARAGVTHDYAAKARLKYIDRVLGFVDVAQLDPMRIVINSGNGAAGPTIDAIIKLWKGRARRLSLSASTMSQIALYQMAFQIRCCQKTTRQQPMLCFVKVQI